jgi:TetR/AcrR family transcriptional regulator
MAKDPVKKTRPQRGEATRERIVAAAVEAFSERGFDAASTRDIAQRAGTDQGLVTYHFPNKDQLWRAAADRIFGLLGKRLDEAVASLEFEDRKERSRGVIRAYVRFAAAHPELFRFLVAEGNRASARMRWLADTYLRPRFEYMKSEGIVPAAGIEKSDAAHALYALTGAASLIFAVAPACRRVTGVDPKRKEAVEAHADFVARLMVP